MKIVRKGSQENLGDAVANECLGKGVKCVWPISRQLKVTIVMAMRSGKHDFFNFSLNLKKIRVKFNCHYTKIYNLKGRYILMGPDVVL